jgi:SAM-dependent methyltransferase
MRPAISYGPGLPDDAELRLCGDVAGKRVLELGGRGGAALAFAARGAKAIVVEPDNDVLGQVRQGASELSAGGEEIRVECHLGEPADLGFATSASVDLVFSAGILSEIDDLPRLLRQVNRVLKADAAFVFSMRHPFGAIVQGTTIVARYGDRGRTISELFMALNRANFRVDVLAEPEPLGEAAAVPPALIVRARKLGL